MARFGEVVEETQAAAVDDVIAVGGDWLGTKTEHAYSVVISGLEAHRAAALVEDLGTSFQFRSDARNQQRVVVETDDLGEAESTFDALQARGANPILGARFTPEMAIVSQWFPWLDTRSSLRAASLVQDHLATVTGRRPVDIDALEVLSKKLDDVAGSPPI
jgi:hypothetical protein